MKITTFFAAVLAALELSAITATKEYVDRRDGSVTTNLTSTIVSATNETLRLAKEYTDTHGGGVSTGVVESISSSVITNHVTSGYLARGNANGYVPLTEFGDGFVINGVSYIPADFITTTYADQNLLPKSYKTDNAETFAGKAAYSGGLMSDQWFPQSYGQIVWEGDRWKIKSADPTYPEAHKGFIATVTEATNIARAEAAPIATNAAEAVVGAVMEYALTNLTGATVTLASGQIGNLTLTSAQTALTLDLNFSSAANRSGDALLYLVNAADTELAVGPSASITPIGYKASDKLKAGTNLVAVTRLAYSGGKSVVNVAIKEVK